MGDCWSFVLLGVGGEGGRGRDRRDVGSVLGSTVPHDCEAKRGVDGWDIRLRERMYVVHERISSRTTKRSF